MPQLHLTSEMVSRIISGRQTCVLYPALADNVSYKSGDIVIVREPWSKTDDGDLIYKADREYPKGIRWKPSIFMETGDVRLTLQVINAEKLPITDIPEENIPKFGHECRENLYREWNVNLPKEKRPKLGTKFNPTVWSIEFKVEKIGTRN